jgi:transcriptional regulator with XRE-family HTH domain
MELIEQVGRRIKEIRNLRGMSQDDLADKLGVNRSFISKLENGKKPISLEHIQKLSKNLDVEPEDLLVDKNKLIKHNEDLIFIKEKFTDQELQVMARYARALIDEDKRKSDED